MTRLTQRAPIRLCACDFKGDVEIPEAIPVQFVASVHGLGLLPQLGQGQFERFQPTAKALFRVMPLVDRAVREVALCVCDGACEPARFVSTQIALQVGDAVRDRLHHVASCHVALRGCLASTLQLGALLEQSLDLRRLVSFRSRDAFCGLKQAPTKSLA